MTVTYKIANSDVHERQKCLALASLVHVINALGLKAHLPLPDEGTPTQLTIHSNKWEALMTHKKGSIVAIIKVFKDPAPYLNLPYLTIVRETEPI